MKFFLLLLLLVAVVAAQESLYPQPFTGRWRGAPFGKATVSLCTVGNKVYGGFSLGFLEGILGPDRRTLTGTIYYGGNTADSQSVQFRVSMNGDDTEIQGFYQFPSGWSGMESWNVLTPTADQSPVDPAACLVPSTSREVSLSGRWVNRATSDFIDVCFGDEGSSFHATWGKVYLRGVTGPKGISGKAAWVNQASKPGFGGAFLRVIDSNPGDDSSVPLLVVGRYTSDLPFVMAAGCGASISGAYACTLNSFEYVGPADEADCSSLSANLAFNGEFYFPPTNSKLVMRAQNNHVFGFFGSGVLEGKIDADDPTFISGYYFAVDYNAALEDTDKFKKQNYYGTFRFQISADGQYLAGTVWANAGQSGVCDDQTKSNLKCSREFFLPRLPSPRLEPGAADMQAIDPGLSTDIDTLGTFSVNFQNGYSKAYRCLDSDRRIYSSYTYNGCGITVGVQRERAAKQVVGSGVAGPASTIEPVNAMSSELWYDDTGYGSWISRRVSQSSLLVSWFAFSDKANNETFATYDLSFCQPERGLTCGVIEYNPLSDSATQDECNFCLKIRTPASSSASVLSFSILILFASLFVFFF